MKPLDHFPARARRAVRGVLTDIDDTLTTEGSLTAEAYGAPERLQGSGLLVVPITGRPAGWCDHIARMWPNAFVFVGDSPNDAPMFDFLPNAVGVANVATFGDQLETPPTYVSRRTSGAGFVELTESLLAVRD